MSPTRTRSPPSPAELDDVAVLVNNAGGALGVEPIERADPADWQAMFDSNVLGVLRMTQALLPALERGTGGHIVITGSIAGHLVYEGGAGYVAAKHGARGDRRDAAARAERPPDPDHRDRARAWSHTEEFSLVRLRGDQAAADKVYAGVDAPLTADDIADCIAFAVTRPAHVNIDLMTVKPLAQAAPYKVARRPS